MKPRTHTCNAIGCRHVISARLLMCLDHWRMVPAPLQREVVGTNKALGSGQRDAATLRKYQDAVARAVATVKEKQERQAAAAAGPSGNLFT